MIPLQNVNIVLAESAGGGAIFFIIVFVIISILSSINTKAKKLREKKQLQNEHRDDLQEDFKDEDDWEYTSTDEKHNHDSDYDEGLAPEPAWKKSDKPKVKTWVNKPTIEESLHSLTETQFEEPHFVEQKLPSEMKKKKRFDKKFFNKDLQPAPTPKPQPENYYSAKLHDRNALRDAIVMSEILAPPKALRDE